MLVGNLEIFMATVSTNLFKAGLKVLLDGVPHNMIANEFVKPGKGQAFNRVKLKNLVNGRLIEKTYKSGETLEVADLVENEMQYLYRDGEEWHFMDPTTYEQLAISSEVVADVGRWLLEQDVCRVMLFNGAPMSVEPPIFVELKVIEADPSVRGDTVSNVTKNVTLITGAVVKTPVFVDVGDVVKVDTRTGEYVGRAKG
jgi:elongation factor P